MRPRGFTLIEIVVALAIGAAVLVAAFGAVRLGLAAWRRTEARAAAMDHSRAIRVVVQRALDGAFPYRHVPPERGEARVLFEGRPDRVTFATVAPPLPDAAPVAFTGVMLSSEPPGLVLRRLPLPNALAFADVPPTLVDRDIVAVRFRYQDQRGAWQDEWDMTREDTLPRAVEATLLGRAGALAEPVLTVALPAARP